MKNKKKNKNKQFDNWEFRQALSSLRSDPIETKKKCKEYLKKYPKDYNSYPYYVSTLITLGEFREAKRITKHLEKLSNKLPSSEREKNNLKRLKKDVVYIKLKLLCYDEKYEELEKYIYDNYRTIKEISVSEVLFYCDMKLNKINKETRDNYSYLFRQIIEYKESDFLSHIQKHLPDYNKDEINPNSNIFTIDFPIDKVLEEIKKYIPSDKRLYQGFIDNTYIFKYDNCGRENNKLVDYFKVACFHNTSNIITIVPISNCENLPYIDINYLVQEKENPKVKRRSQIDKFNQKYSK